MNIISFHIFCKKMIKCHCLFVITIVVVLGCFLAEHANGYMEGNNPYHRVEMLDSKGKFQLEWRVDWNVKRVTFNVTVETRGYIGFGLSRNGKMTGADVVIGGVMPSGKRYFSDRYAVAQQMPKEDPSQDWTLHDARESDMHTFLSFSRDFDTCDPQDYPITEDKISLIWAYGEKDNIRAYHHQNRGEYPVYLLHPDYTPPIVNHESVRAHPRFPDKTNTSKLHKNLKVWTVISRVQLRAADTTYWCIIHKAPTLDRKHHIVGFEVRYPNEQSRRHTHHLSHHRCHAPAGQNANKYFGPFVSHPGQVCISLRAPMGSMPTQFCTEFFQVYAVGGRPYFYPPNVGLPFGETKDEYYLLQVHYDNPDKLTNIEVDLSIDYYYTSELRPNDASILAVRHDSPGLTPSLLIPPSSVDHTVYGFCGSDCSRKMFPPEGVKFFGLLLHSHNTGRSIRLHHFRGNEELEWIQSDDNYGFDYQQVKAMNREVKILPGDLLAVISV